MIEVGQILDKYELLERVGQGGMAVVYRGMDRSLKRQVAIKVLHRHLAEHQEARDRFEREAQAVAKLRHENILEIYDFSGNDSSESYIVTEFIDGTTLREFVTDHPIKHPELGAMITAQICRALVHAHGLGILHRDIKPENVMIRGDGVVKLTDFGIAQMLDLRRMTVTGQLLGSPAYMSPEHIEGRQLDFRTDVFAVGIVLYQLVVGDLPFQGKNPHEILKRIADCRFTDPRVANPLVGNELGRIIITAMAREPADRYPSIGAMLEALDRYLAGSGIDDLRAELAAYFASPSSYELAIRTRLIHHLTRRGKTQLVTDRVAAIEAFNRVLSLDPANEEVLREIGRLSRGQWLRRSLLTVFAVGAVTAAIVVGRSALTPKAASRAVVDWDAGGAPSAAFGSADAGTLDAGAAVALALPVDAGVAGIDAALARRVSDDARRVERVKVAAVIDAGPAASAARAFSLQVTQRGSQFSVNGGPWKTIAGNRASFEVGGGEHSVRVRHACCEEERVAIGAADPARELAVTLGYLPATITLECDAAGVRVQMDGRPARLGRNPVVFAADDAFASRSVAVVFFSAQAGTDEHKVTVRPNENQVIRCELK